MEINFQDYLSEQEVKQILIDEITNQVRSKLRSDIDFERIFDNAAYSIVFKMLDDSVDYDIAEKIKSKTIQIIEKQDSYGLFRKADAWNREESKAYTYLQQAVEENKELVFEAVRQALCNINKELLQEEINEYVIRAILEKLTGK